MPLPSRRFPPASIRPRPASTSSLSWDDKDRNMKKLISLGFALLGAICALLAQQERNELVLKGQGRTPKLAIPDLRGAGDAQKFMAAFNQTDRKSTRLNSSHGYTSY